MRRRLVLLVLAACAAVAGCGKDDGPDTATVERTTTRVELLESVTSSTSEGVVRFDPSRIYRREAPGVVTVISTGLRSSDRDEGRGRSGLGSGFVLGEDGEIVTNAHVVTSGEGAEIREAKEVYVRFQDDNQVRAEIVGFDPFSDVALLRVDPSGLTLRPLPLGSAEDVVVGEPVAAIGSPFGEEQSLSIGVVSALGRSIASLTGFQTAGAIQTDAAINSGNSGGPLLNARGEVLGINSQIRTRSGEGSGVGFAVPVDTVERSVRQLRESGRVRYAFLGVSTTAVYPQLAERFDLPVARGAWVQEVSDDGPAEKAGVEAGDDEVTFQARPYVPGGDLITAVDGVALDEEADLGTVLLDKLPGDEATLEIYRDGQRRDLVVTLGDRPRNAPRTP